MTVRALGILLLRLMGVMWLVSGIGQALNVAASYLFPIRSADPSITRLVLVSNAANVVVTLAGAAILLAGAERIIRLIAPPEETVADAAPSRLSAAEWQSVLFAAIGVYFLLSALQSIAQAAYLIARDPDTAGYILRSHQQQVFGGAVQLIAAVVLLVFRGRLVRQ